MAQTLSLKKRMLPTSLTRRAAFVPLWSLAFLLLGLWNLSMPPLWWDEGWTLAVARTWVEQGHYGRLLDGARVGPGMEAAFPVTGLIALTFRLFGVGVWQGRLVGVLFALGSLAALYWLAKRLYHRSVARATLVVVLLMSMHPQLHPLIMGRQVLAEMPMLFFLLAGYSCLLLTLSRSGWYVAPTMLMWAIALITKAQVFPFWIASLAVLLLANVYAHCLRRAALIATVIGGSLLLSRALLWPQMWLLADPAAPRQAVDGLYQVMAIVLTPFNRLYAAKQVLFFGMPTLLGLGYAALRLKERRERAPASAASDVHLALLALAGSWLAWFLLLSVGVPRYLFPATFLGSLFVAALLGNLTGGFDLRATLKRAAYALAHPRSLAHSGGALLAVLLISGAVPLTSLTLWRSYVTSADTSASAVAAFFNTQTSPTTLIETYETELHFLLDRPYHYPPDQTHVELNRRSLLGQAANVTYNPLAADPDYLVVGKFARGNALYEPVIQRGDFRLLQRYGGYDVYQRAR